MKTPSIQELAVRLEAIERRLSSNAAMPASATVASKFRQQLTLREKTFRRRHYSPIIRNDKAFEMAVRMLSDGCTYDEVTGELHNKLKFRTSMTSVGRFWNLYLEVMS